MDAEAPKRQLREAGGTVWRTAVLAVATLLVLVLYLGTAVLVYRERMAEGPLILFTGVILGYLLRSVRDLV